MRRRIFSIWCILSAILCLATAGLWGRSYFRGDRVVHASVQTAGVRDGYLTSASGCLWYYHETIQFSGRVGGPTTGPSPSPSPSPSGARRWQITSERPLPRAALIGEYRSDGVYFVGFGHFSRTWPPPGSSPAPRRRGEWAILLPHWFVTLLFAAGPLRWGILKRRELRLRAPNACRACGYDLRATPEALGPLLDRCPECGGSV